QIAELSPATAFRGASLRGIDLRGENLSGFDFSDADLTSADLRGADLSGARGLDRAILTDIVTNLATCWPPQLNRSIYDSSSKSYENAFPLREADYLPISWDDLFRADALRSVGADALGSLAQRLPLADALTAAKAISRDVYRARALGWLAQHLPLQQIP